MRPSARASRTDIARRWLLPHYSVGVHPSRQKLLADLERHVPADETERAHVAAVIKLVTAEAACFARTTFAPGHVTASAYVLDPRGRLLLHHHRRLDRWLQLGGHDEGELDPAATAAREAREESGLDDLELVSDVILDVDVHSIPAGRNEPEHLHHDVRYLFRTRRPDGIRRDDAESRALAFFPLDEARARLVDCDRVIRKIARLTGTSA
jgi:8-oxo-dGTP pyrophosphatase MutT (NUDIX family)